MSRYTVETFSFVAEDHKYPLVELPTNQRVVVVLSSHAASKADGDTWYVTALVEVDA